MFQMSVEGFETVLKHINDLISPQKIQGGPHPVLSDERLALTLRVLATGESFQSLSFQFGISRVVVSYIIKSRCDIIVERMVPILISLPSFPNEWHKIAAKFENSCNYPHAIEAVDGKHVMMEKPAICGSFYCNHKKSHSVILMAVTGPHYECVWADVTFNGRNTDTGCGTSLDYTKLSLLFFSLLFTIEKWFFLSHIYIILLHK